MKKELFLVVALMVASGCLSTKEVVDVADMEERKERTVFAKEVVTVNGVSFNMINIPAGVFLMGSSSDTPGNFENEGPQHRVSISACQMGETEVTQGLWKAVMGNNPSFFKQCGDNCPVEQVSWDEVQKFIKALNQEVPGGGFRLPSEAEWEYVCRAGTKTPFSFGKCLSSEQANYDGGHPLTGCAMGEFQKQTVPVASYPPNPWGLYDMHGNVWEWCRDFYSGKAYREHQSSDPVYMGMGPYRSFRGGGWRSYARTCRSASRSGYPSGDSYRYLGFRLARKR